MAPAFWLPGGLTGRVRRRGGPSHLQLLRATYKAAARPVATSRRASAPPLVTPPAGGAGPPRAAGSAPRRPRRSPPGARRLRPRHRSDLSLSASARAVRPSITDAVRARGGQGRACCGSRALGVRGVGPGRQSPALPAGSPRARALRPAGRLWTRGRSGGSLSAYRTRVLPARPHNALPARWPAGLLGREGEAQLLSAGLPGGRGRLGAS